LKFDGKLHYLRNAQQMDNLMGVNYIFRVKGCEQIITIGADRTIRYWEPESWTCTKKIKLRNYPIKYLELFTDQKSVLIQGPNYEIEVWDLSNGKPIAYLDLKELIGPDYKNIKWVKLFNKDENLGIYLSYWYYSIMEIWDWKRKEKLRSLRFRDNEKYLKGLFKYNSYGIVRDYLKKSSKLDIQDLITQEVIKEENNRYLIKNPRMLQNDRYIIYNRLDSEIRVFDWQNDKIIRKIKFSDSGYPYFFISASRDAVLWFEEPRLLKSWKISEEIIEYELKEPVTFSDDIRFFSDEKYLCGISGARIYVYELENGELILSRPQKFNDGQLWIDDDEMMCILGAGNVIQIRDPSSFKLLKELRRHKKPISDFKVSKDKNLLVSAGDAGLVHIWNLRDRLYWKPVIIPKDAILVDTDNPIVDELKFAFGAYRTMESFFLGPEADRFIITTDMGELIVIRIKDSLVLKRAQACDLELLKKQGKDPWAGKLIKSLAFFDNNTKIVTLTKDRCIRVWSLPELKLLYTIEDAAQDPEKLLMLRDEGLAVTLYRKDGRKGMKMWDLIRKECLYSVSVQFNSIDDFPIFNNGRNIILADNNLIKIYDSRSGECVKVLKGHTDYVDSLKLFRNDKFLLSSSYDKTLRVWDLETGECVKVFSLEQCTVSFFVLDYDGEFIYVRYYEYEESNGNYLDIIYDGSSFSEIRRIKPILYEPRFIKTSDGRKLLLSIDGEFKLYDINNDKHYTKPILDKSFLYGRGIKYFSKIVDHYYIPQLDSYAIGYKCGCIELWSPDLERIHTLVFNFEYYEDPSEYIYNMVLNRTYRDRERWYAELIDEFDKLNPISVAISEDGSRIFTGFDNSYIYGYVINGIHFNISRRIFKSRRIHPKLERINFTNDGKYLIVKDKYCIQIWDYYLKKDKSSYRYYDKIEEYIDEIIPILKLSYFEPDYGAKHGRLPLYDKYTLLVFDPTIATVWGSNFERFIKNLIEHCKVNDRVYKFHSEWYLQKVRQYLKRLGRRVPRDMVRNSTSDPIHLQDLMIKDYKLTPDKKYLLVRYPDSLELWDIQSGSLAHEFVNEYEIVSALSLKNNRVFICDLAGNVMIWEYIEN